MTALYFGSKGHHKSALRLLDDRLSQAIREGRKNWIRVLSHHAAVIANSLGDLGVVRRYYEQALAHCPDSAITLYGLADGLLRQGQNDMAREYAAKCRQACLRSSSGEDEETLKMVERQWPNLADHV